MAQLSARTAVAIRRLNRDGRRGLGGFTNNTERVEAIAFAMHRRALLGASLALAGASAGCAPEAPPKGRVPVPFWFMYGGRNRTTLETLVARFNASQRDIWVQAVFQGDYFEGLAKLRTALAAGGEVVPYLAEAGVLEPLDDYPGARSLPLVAALGQSGSFVGGAARPLVTLPFNRSTPIAYLNDALCRGRAAPASWSELRDFARAFTLRPYSSATDVACYGFACPIDWWFWLALVGQAGGRVVELDGRLSLGDAAGVEALELWQALVAEGVMQPPTGRDYNAWERQNQAFLAGRVAMIWSSTAFVRYFEETAGFPVRAAPLPEGRVRSVPTGGTYFVLPCAAPSELKRAAFELVRFLLEPESMAFWSSETGYLPVTRGAVALLEAKGHFRAHPNYRVALDQLAVAAPLPWHKSLFRVQRELVQPALESAVLSGRSARGALDEARRLAREGAL